MLFTYSLPNIVYCCNSKNNAKANELQNLMTGSLKKFWYWKLQILFQSDPSPSKDCKLHKLDITK